MLVPISKSTDSRPQESLIYRMLSISLPSKGKITERTLRFQHVMELANDIATRDPKSLSTLVRLVAAPLQAMTTTAAAYAESHTVKRKDNFGAFFFEEDQAISINRESANDISPRRTNQIYRLRLGIDPVLATPRRRDDLAKALANIGFGKLEGAWRQDKNHRVAVLLPIGIGIVHGGNHSLTAGIANVEGYIDSSDFRDLTPLYPHVYYDGTAFVRSHDGYILSEPSREEPGILFEIGRLMMMHGVQPSVKPTSSAEAPTPIRSLGEFYYHVLLNGQDAGAELPVSAAVHTLSQVGFKEGSTEWDQALHFEAPFKHPYSQDTVQLKKMQYRLVAKDLKYVRSPLSND